MKGRQGATLSRKERAGDGGSGTSLPPSGSHSNQPLRMTLQAEPASRKRGAMRAQRRKGVSVAVARPEGRVRGRWGEAAGRGCLREAGRARRPRGRGGAAPQTGKRNCGGRGLSSGRGVSSGERGARRRD